MKAISVLKYSLEFRLLRLEHQINFVLGPLKSDLENCTLEYFTQKVAVFKSRLQVGNKIWIQ